MVPGAPKAKSQELQAIERLEEEIRILREELKSSGR